MLNLRKRIWFFLRSEKGFTVFKWGGGAIIAAVSQNDNSHFSQLKNL